jgi:hypothetical protein
MCSTLYGMAIALIRAAECCPSKRFQELAMRTLLSAAVLFATSFAVFAGPAPLPEPGVIGLVGVGVAALLISRRKKK